MKKPIYFSLIICLCILLTACGEKKLICIKSTTENGITTKENIEVIFKKDKAISTKMLMNMKFNSNTESKINTTYKLLKTTFKNFEDQKGVEISTNRKNNTINFTMNIDLKEIKNSKNLGLEFSKNDSLENIKNNFKSDGYTCE